MKKSFDNLAKLRDYLDPNYAGRDWNLATAMVIKGDALLQVMGDWAKGEFKNANKEAGKDYLCYRFPGTDGSVLYNTDMFAFFQVSADRQPAQTALAEATMNPEVQIDFNVIKGSAPAHGRFGRQIRRLRQESHRGHQGSQRQGHSWLHGPELRPAARDRDGLRRRDKISHGEIKTSDEAVKQSSWRSTARIIAGDLPACAGEGSRCELRKGLGRRRS
jgi:glucose/mannose transport system substrate-binding protein